MREVAGGKPAYGVLAALGAALAACGPAAAPPSAGPATSSASVAAMPTARATTETAPRPAEGTDSPVVLAIENEGLVTLASDGAHPLFATDKGLVGLAIAPDGAVFASFYDEGTVLLVEGSPPRRLGAQRFDRFVALGAKEAWGITDDIDWEVQRFDGERWITEKTRLDFDGYYDDNKFNDVAREANGDLWVSSSNGLWRRDAGGWWPVAPPESVGKLGGPSSAPDDLLATPDGIVGRFGRPCFVRERAGWTAATCPALHGVRGRHARDARGRSWRATDLGLTIDDDRGHTVASYAPGTIDGARGPIAGIAIAGNGLGRLPAPRLAGAWTITGSFELYKSAKPLADATVKLCAGRGGCRRGDTAQSTTTASDGSFTFTDVPDGVHDVTPIIPSGLEACSGIFSESFGATVSTPRGCDAITRTCALGTLRVCLPFEMPPPPR